MPRNCGYGRKACATLPTNPGNGTLIPAATACGDVTEAFNKVPRERYFASRSFQGRLWVSPWTSLPTYSPRMTNWAGSVRSIPKPIFEARAAFFPPSPPKKLTLDPLSELGLRFGKGGMMAGNPLFQLNAGSMPLFKVAVPAVAAQP